MATQQEREHHLVVREDGATDVLVQIVLEVVLEVANPPLQNPRLVAEIKRTNSFNEHGDEPELGAWCLTLEEIFILIPAVTRQPTGTFCHI